MLAATACVVYRYVAMPFDKSMKCEMRERIATEAIQKIKSNGAG
jgi:hypothetical protein